MEQGINNTISTIEKPKIPACAYLRESEEDKNKKNTSMDNQLAINKAKAESLGYEIVEVFRDYNKSGATLFRKGMQDLIKKSKEKRWEAVLIKDPSRFSRSLLDQEILARDFKELGIKIISCDGAFDNDLQRQITGVVNEEYIRKCRRDTQQLHEIKLADNIPLNRPPMGLKIPFASKKNVNGRANPSYDPKVEKKFIPSLVDLRKVIRMFEMKRADASIKEISEEFRMHFQTIQHILQNKTYMGYTCYKGVWKKGRHDAVIPIELWEAVNGELKIKVENVTS